MSDEMPNHITTTFFLCAPELSGISGGSIMHLGGHIGSLQPIGHLSRTDQAPWLIWTDQAPQPD